MSSVVFPFSATEPGFYLSVSIIAQMDGPTHGAPMFADEMEALLKRARDAVVQAARLEKMGSEGGWALWSGPFCQMNSTSMELNVWVFDDEGGRRSAAFVRALLRQAKFDVHCDSAVVSDGAWTGMSVWPIHVRQRDAVYGSFLPEASPAAVDITAGAVPRSH